MESWELTKQELADVVGGDYATAGECLRAIATAAGVKMARRIQEQFLIGSPEREQLDEWLKGQGL